MARNSPLRHARATTEIQAALADLRLVVERLTAIVDGEGESAPVPAAPAEPDIEWITVAEASRLRCCTKPTMISLARKHGFGVASGGRWRIDRQKFLRWQAGG